MGTLHFLPQCQHIEANFPAFALHIEAEYLRHDIAAIGHPHHLLILETPHLPLQIFHHLGRLGLRLEELLRM